VELSGLTGVTGHRDDHELAACSPTATGQLLLEYRDAA